MGPPEVAQSLGLIYRCSEETRLLESRPKAVGGFVIVILPDRNVSQTSHCYEFGARQISLLREGRRGSIGHGRLRVVLALHFQDPSCLATSQRNDDWIVV